MKLAKIISNILSSLFTCKRLEDSLVVMQQLQTQEISALRRRGVKDSKYIKRLIVKLKYADPEGKSTTIETLTNEVNRLRRELNAQTTV